MTDSRDTTQAPTVDLCEVDGCARPAGHGHFGLYCLPCSDLPYGAGPAADPVDPREVPMTGVCFDCEGYHEAAYSHEGQFGEGPIWAVPCPVDGLTGYVTLAAVTPICRCPGLADQGEGEDGQSWTCPECGRAWLGLSS